MWAAAFTYPCPVAESEHQRNQSRFQFGQGCQVIGGETSNVVACAYFAQEATAGKKKVEVNDQMLERTERLHF